MQQSRNIEISTDSRDYQHDTLHANRNITGSENERGQQRETISGINNVYLAKNTLHKQTTNQQGLISHIEPHEIATAYFLEYCTYSLLKVHTASTYYSLCFYFIHVLRSTGTAQVLHLI